MTDPQLTSHPTVPHAKPASRRARLGVSGLVFVFITVFLAIGAVNSQNNLLFWVFGLAVAAVIVSGIVSGNSLMGVRLACLNIPDTPVGVGQDIAYTIVSVNRLLPVFGLTIRELGAEGVQDGCALLVPPRGRTRAVTRWVPARRGPHDFATVLLESRFPFGFIIKTLEFVTPRRALAVPPVIELNPSVVAAMGEGSSEHRVKRARRGAVGSYFGLRAYAPGDPRRTIAWRPSARRSELLVVEHAELEGRSVWIHLPRPEGSPETYLAERGIALAAAVVRAGVGTGRPVGLWVPWAGIRVSPATGPTAERRAIRALALLDTARPAAADSQPPARPGDTTLTVHLSAQAQHDPRRFDPARPQDWLAPDAELHPSLMPPSGGSPAGSPGRAGRGMS